jgi:hypothetical protein
MHRWGLQLPMTVSWARMRCKLRQRCGGGISCIRTGIAVRFLEANKLSGFAVNLVAAVPYASTRSYG